MVITADRKPEPISRTGSSISVINRRNTRDKQSRLAGRCVANRSRPRYFRDRRTGCTTNIRLRGGNTGQTLVMIDGIRINDPTAASGDFDFAMFAPSCHRTDRGAERPAERALWFGRDGRRRQHHHQDGLGPGAIQCPDRRRKLRHCGHQWIGDRLAGALVLCLHWRRPEQRRLLALWLSHSRDRGEIRPA